MPSEGPSDVKFEIGHVLFIDIVGYLFQVAVLYAIRKEPDQMLKWLETAYATHDSGMVELAVTPFFLPYRDDPRFMALCQKLNVQLPATSAKP
jgi:hypothetical protein